MTAGHALDDDDRAPWLEPRSAPGWAEPTAAWWGGRRSSALHRDLPAALRAASPRVRFLHLDGDPEVIADRMRRRPGHFMKV